MNQQKAYNEIKAHLLTQNARSVTSALPLDNRVCLYRGPNNLKCAIGAMIPDSLYDPEMDENPQGVIDLLETYPALADHFSEVYGVEGFDDREFLARFQKLHDTNEPADWPSRLAEEAKFEGLEA